LVAQSRAFLRGDSQRIQRLLAERMEKARTHWPSRRRPGTGIGFGR
jgi:hypothetical protein